MYKHFFNKAAMTVGFDERLSPIKMLCVSLQHVLAVFGGIVAAPLIIAMGMQLSTEDTAYLVSASLVVSGLATALQIQRLGPLGSGLLSIQGTSFTFIGPLIFSYFTLLEGHSSQQALGLVLGTCAVCALCVMFILRFVEKLQKWVTTNVSGTTVILIGLSLVWVTLGNLFKEFRSAEKSDFSAWWVLALALAVFVVTWLLALSRNSVIRLTSVTIGLVFGFIVAWLLGMVDISPLDNLELFFFPSVSKFPLGFDFAIFFVLLPIFLISAIESIGDLSATSKLSGFNTGDKLYWQRIRGGLMGDAFNSFVAALLCSFPNTTFSQNNGVIRLTGVCQPKVGLYVAVFLVVLGIFPIVGALFIVLPSAVLSGATLLMFFMVVISGIELVKSGGEEIKSWTLVSCAIVASVLASVLVKNTSFLPRWLETFLQFPVSTGACCALVGELLRSRYKTLQRLSPRSSS